MKRKAINLYALRLLSLLIALSLVLGGGALTVSADDDRYTQWEYDPATDTLTALYPNGISDVFTQIGELSNRIRYMPSVHYNYHNDADMGGGSMSVSAPSFMSRYAVLGDGTALATKEGHEELANMLKGTVNNGHRICADGSSDYYCSASLSLLTDLRTLDDSQAVSYTLFDLRDIHRYEIFGMSNGGWYGVLLGYIFETQDGLFFADPADLPDNCFSDNAKLLPKTTETLSLIPLTEELTETVYERVAEVTLHHDSYHSESSFVEDSFEQATTGLIYTTIIILGILVPIAPIVLGLCLPHSKGLGYKKRWYLLTALGGAWMLLGILLLILMITVL